MHGLTLDAGFDCIMRCYGSLAEYLNGNSEVIREDSLHSCMSGESLTPEGIFI